MEQAQNQVQAQMIGLGGTTRHAKVLPSSKEGVVLYPSFGYEFLKFDFPTKPNLVNCVKLSEKSCFFNFTNTCSYAHGLLYGGLCKHHNSLILDRTHVGLKIDNATINVRPIPNENSTGKILFPVLSMMLPGKSKEEVRQELCKSPQLCPEATDISTFYAALSNLTENVPAGVTKNAIQMYCISLRDQYQDFMDLYQPLITNTYVNVIITIKMLDEYLAKSYWFKSLNLESIEKDDKCAAFKIPLQAFLLPDILMILGYVLNEVNINNTPSNALIYNNQILNGHFVSGIGPGIWNSLQESKNFKDNANKYPNYEQEIKQKLLKLPEHANYDVDVFNAWSIGISPTIAITHMDQRRKEIVGLNELMINLTQKPFEA